MKFLRVVQTQEAVFHIVGGREFAEDESKMTTGTLNAAGGVEFGKESNQHAVSLTKRDGEKQEPREESIVIAPKGT